MRKRNNRNKKIQAILFTIIATIFVSWLIYESIRTSSLIPLVGVLLVGYGAIKDLIYYVKHWKEWEGKK